MLSKEDLILISDRLDKIVNPSEDELNLKQRIHLMIEMQEFQEEINKKRNDLESRLKSLMKIDK